MANRVIIAVANALGIELGSLPSKRTRGRLHLEGGCWAQICAATALTDAKAEAQADGRVFTMCEGKDTTSANGWHVQVHSTHVTTNSGRISMVNDAPLVHNKTAVTQAAHTQKVRSTIVSLSQGEVKRDVEVHSKISDSANNETATNRLEGIRLSVPCVGHCAQNTAYHGSTPDEGKHAFVKCLCGSEWPPGGGGDGPVGCSVLGRGAEPPQFWVLLIWLEPGISHVTWVHHDATMCLPCFVCSILPVLHFLRFDLCVL